MEGRKICKGKLKPDFKQECNHPIMILKSAPVSEVGTNIVKQVTIFGCMNPNCDMNNVEIERSEHELETF